MPHGCAGLQLTPPLRVPVRRRAPGIAAALAQGLCCGLGATAPLTTFAFPSLAAVKETCDWFTANYAIARK